ncbi:chymotrypsin inhibitor [Apis mellifera caucasica]|uniref:Chymotrypsin inhibitor n=1 Tax=Apis mellifera TaxID=7460 RepID=A0A7M7FYD6_APIME|nr:chymotrypsin inhibitor [Apis mellifera]KAG6795042.1 chymotrypsin inhibitor [Apis mellifera caucasica]|eukprot:XP_001121077.2 chymotrypsin inhibitor [Apis mellifera]
MTRIITIFVLLAAIAYSNAYPDGSPENEDVKCDVNEEFTSCGSECVDTCEKPASPICNLKCVIGCQCKPGFVRNRESKCVLTRDC